MEFIKLKSEEKSNHKNLIYFYNLEPNKKYLETSSKAFFIFFIFEKNNKHFLVLFNNEKNEDFTSTFNYNFSGSFSLDPKLKEFIKENSYIKKKLYKSVDYYFPIYLDNNGFELFYKINENFIKATTAQKKINPAEKLYRNLPNEEKFIKLMLFNNIYLFDLDTNNEISEKIKMLQISFIKNYGNKITFTENEVDKEINKRNQQEIKFIKSNINENNKFYPKLKLNDYIFSSLRAPEKEKDKYPYKTTYKEIIIGI
jgi:hypothetical protein